MSGGTQLRRLDQNELVPGSVLPADLRDHNGRVLVRAGEVLGPDQLGFLTKHAAAGVYVGADWPGANVRPPSREQPTARDSEEAQTLGRCWTGRKTRTHERHVWQARLTLELEENGSDGTRRRRLEVTTENLSTAGFAFVYHGYVHPGTTVRATFDALSGGLEVMGVVRNCILVAGTRHRVGVEFLNVRRDEQKSDEPQRPAGESAELR